MAFHKQEEILDLARIGGGAATEKFEDECAKVLENILDVNTSETAAREITLKVKFKPNRVRSSSDVEITCTSKLAPAVSHETSIFHGRDSRGQIKVAEQDLRQMGFDDVDQPEKDKPLAPVRQINPAK